MKKKAKVKNKSKDNEIGRESRRHKKKQANREERVK